MNEQKPDSPGLWTREGKFYRVRTAFEEHLAVWEIRFDGEPASEELSTQVPTGNWQKLGVPVTAWEARENLRKWLDTEMPNTSWREDGEIADRAAEIFAGVQEPEPPIVRLQFPDGSVPETLAECAEGWKREYDKRDQEANELQEKITRLEGEIAKLKGERSCAAEKTHDLRAVMRNIVHVAMSHGWDEGWTHGDLPTWLDSTLNELGAEIESGKARTQAILAKIDKYKSVLVEQQDFSGAAAARQCYLLIERATKKTAEGVAATEHVVAAWGKTVATPEVIEGKGQAVTLAQHGLWVEESPEGVYGVILKQDEDWFEQGYRYMRCPTFPPRKPAFVAPEKPELVLVRRKDGKDNPRWATFDGPNLYRFVGGFWGKELVDVIDPTTGEPIAEEEA